MKNNRILKRIQADLTDEELRNNSKLKEEKEILEEHYNTCKPFAREFAKLLEKIESIKREMEDFSLPSIYTDLSKDEFLNEYFDKGTAFYQCCEDTDADYYYNEIITICEDLILISKNLRDNLLPSSFAN